MFDVWDDVGTHKYWRVEHETGGIWHKDLEVRLRRQVLFDVWFPRATTVTLRSQRCRSCGTVCYVPRPTHDDIVRKYDFLRSALNGSPSLVMSPRIEASDLARAEAILATLAPYLPNSARVLDVGGGDGRLMGPFIDGGFECSLVDRVDHTRPGVRKLADSLDALTAGAVFDAAVLSHVLEHVASPRRLLEQMHSRLSQAGTVYVEVPFEAFYSNARNPIVAEPVEHINFFTPAGVRRILGAAGFEVDLAEVGSSSYEGRPLPVIRAVGIKRQCQPGAT